jgi:hypothetical protein
MFTEADFSTPKLQPPGKGLPKLELFMAQILVGIKMRTTSQQEACKVFAKEKEEITSLVNQVEPPLASKRVLIDRLRGLEDSSRYWSLHMTVEHLRIVNRFTIDVIRSLRQGTKPQIAASTASVKPQDNIDHSVIQSFESVCREFETTFSPTENLKTSITLAHPWFGELNAEQWHFFAGFHMSLHKKQMHKIIEKLQLEGRGMTLICPLN